MDYNKMTPTMMQKWLMENKKDDKEIIKQFLTECVSEKTKKMKVEKAKQFFVKHFSDEIEFENVPTPKERGKRVSLVAELEALLND